jgi:hypothetical protein
MKARKNAATFLDGQLVRPSGNVLLRARTQAVRVRKRARGIGIDVALIVQPELADLGLAFGVRDAIVSLIAKGVMGGLHAHGAEKQRTCRAIFYIAAVVMIIVIPAARQKGQA